MDFPDPLFESAVDGKKLCLVCAKKPASASLRTVCRPVVPLCDDCRADWNFFGYLILKKIKPAKLISGIIKYKMTHPFQAPSWATLWRDVRAFQEWSAGMKKFLQSRRDDG
jgi:hypothetical protein